MKKILMGLFLIGSISALAGQYTDGTYRGLYISRQETEVEVQFDLKDDIITKATFRALSYKGHDWLKEDEFIAKNAGYLKTLEEITGKKIQDVLPTLYNEEEIETAGATVRKGKIRAALQYGLNLGPFRLAKK
ncbi:MAG: hypothetical protein SPJ84_03150 [Fusobacterium gastrosuis]|uniref:hypothetical protein n=1 Tax=Fusobacterium gastrosuis TaxID=1755100 RepID=UPI002A92B3D7|nr:hypothetical protein [Fusobacteriaceae bacterium]MDY5794804.1 hypothetical protein [Fusobacterium gastrosuis]